MGNCVSASTIMQIGSQIMQDFFSKSLLGQMSSALQASSHCDEPTSTEAVRGFMNCSFLKGQREAWEIIFFLFLSQTICIAILGFILYRKGKRVVSRITANTQSNSISIGTCSTEQSSLPIRSQQSGGALAVTSDRDARNGIGRSRVGAAVRRFEDVADFDF